MPVSRIDRARGAAYEKQNGHDLDHYDDVVGFRAFAHAANQEVAQDHEDQQGRQVEPASGELPFNDRGRGKLLRQMKSEQVLQDVVQICGEPHRDAHIREGVLKNQVPSDDPGEDLAERRVRIGVCAPGNGNHGSQLGIAKSREAAGYRHQDERERNRRTSAGAPGQRGRVSSVQQQVEHRGLENRLAEEVLAGRGCSGYCENSRPDDRADTERHQAPDAQSLAQSDRGILGARNQRVDALGAEKLVHGRGPVPLGLPLARPLRRSSDLPLQRSSRHAGSSLGFGWRLLACGAFQFLTFGFVGNIFGVHQVFFSPAYFSTSFFSP